MNAQTNDFGGTNIQSSSQFDELNDDTQDLFDEENYDLSSNTHLFLRTMDGDELLSDVNVYPNQTDALINIYIPDKFQFLDIKIYDIRSSLLLTRRRTPGTIPIDLSSFKSGIYYIHIVNQQDKSTKIYRVLKK